MFSDRLRAARGQLGYSQRAVAEKLSISQQAYARYEAGTSSPNPEMLGRIAHLLGVSADFLLGRPMASPSKGAVQIPVLGRVVAGIPMEAIETVIDYEEIPEEMAAAHQYFALKITGDSMEPKFSAGDVVIVRQQDTVQTGDIAIVLVNGDNATIKRVKLSPEGIMLIPTNAAYEPMFYTNAQIASLPVRILGKVVELRAKF